MKRATLTPVAPRPTKLARLVANLKLNFNDWKEFRKAAKGQITGADATAIVAKARSVKLTPEQAKALRFQIEVFQGRSTSEAREVFRKFLVNAPYEVRGTAGWAPSARGRTCLGVHRQAKSADHVVAH